MARLLLAWLRCRAAELHLSRRGNTRPSSRAGMANGRAGPYAGGSRMKVLRLAARVFVIGLVVWLCVARYLVGRVGTLFVRGKDRRRAAVARLRGRVLRSGMTTLGATFIKLGQVMSTRPDLFDPELID